MFEMVKITYISILYKQKILPYLFSLNILKLFCCDTHDGTEFDERKTKYRS